MACVASTAASGQTAGEALRHAHQIRLDAGRVAGEDRPGAAEADGDLIGDQEYAVPVAELTYVFSDLRIVHRMPPAHCTRGSTMSAHTSLAVRLEQGAQKARRRAPRNRRAISPPREPLEASGAGANRLRRSNGHRRAGTANVADRECAEWLRRVPPPSAIQLGAPRSRVVNECKSHLQAPLPRRPSRCRRRTLSLPPRDRARAARAQGAFGERDRGLVREAGEGSPVRACPPPAPSPARCAAPRGRRGPPPARDRAPPRRRARSATRLRRSLCPSRAAKARGSSGTTGAAISTRSRAGGPTSSATRSRASRRRSRGRRARSNR